MNCPNCKKEILLKREDIKLHKTGRQADCPECGKGILITKRYKGPEKQKIKMSKKDRLRLRREND